MVLLGAVACGETLDRYSDVKDLRVLAIRAEPPEKLLDTAWIQNALAGRPSQSLTMRFEALVVDPRGGPVDYRWSFCPIESSTACANYEGVRDDSPEYAAALDDLRALALGDTAVPLDEGVEAQGLGVRGVWPYQVAPFYLPSVSSDLYAYHLKTSFLGFGLGSWPSAVLDLSKDGETVLASKRVALSIAKPSAFSDLLTARFGITLCTDPPQSPDCITIKDPEAPNANPEFSGVEVAQGERSDATFRPIALDGATGVAGPVAVRTGHAIRIRPLFTAASAQPYQLFKADLETNTIFVDDVREQISVSWFTSAGSVADELTWPKFTKTLDTIYFAPSRAPNNGLATVWMVARDQRGGTSWLSLEIVVQPY